MPYTVIYQSKARENFTISEIEKMLIKAKAFNSKNEITGCILYCQNRFIQIIEGEKEKIDNLYDKIKSDSRHYKVTTLFHEATEESLWDDWSMAFYKFSGDSVKDQHNRMLLEVYFDHAKNKSKALVELKKHVQELLQIN